MEMTNIGVENLSGAIVAQAVKDYYAAYKALLEGSRTATAERTMAECKRFFFSDWFMLLSSTNPDTLIDTIEAKVESDLLKKKEATKK